MALLDLIRRLERAQALQNDRFNAAAGGRSRPLGGGFAHFRGEGHPLNQALGLLDPVAEAELVEVEAWLGQGGHPTVLEVSPGADAALWPLLARRGYAVHQFQQLWVRALAGALPEFAGVQVRPASLDEVRVYNQVVAAGFLEVADWRNLEPPFAMALEVEQAWGFLAFLDGQPCGGGMLGLVDGVAMLSGDGVPPPFRGRGVQKALIAARLRVAQAAGCDLACAGTEPATASQRSYEACGFRVAYPKLEMILSPLDPGSPSHPAESPES